jgi:predicted TIM-barrel fold metal-dependent hydrolase
VREFWAQVAKLHVPVYLHPREPLPSQRRAIQGYPELVGSAWAFAYETSSHAVRLMLSGLFDEFPGVQVILGHMGEGLPFMLPRLQHRLDEQRGGEKAPKRSAARVTISPTISTSLRAAISIPSPCWKVSSKLASTAFCFRSTTPMSRWTQAVAGSTTFASTIRPS